MPYRWYYLPHMVVRMRHTKSQTANRRSHHALKPTGIVKDPQTGVPHLRHRVSLADGRYKGRQVIDMVKKVEKKQKTTKKK
jgi:large subunit ribosomal protein L32